MNPLTHHEILTLIEPFTRRGLQADLAATDRAGRRLVFKPVDRPLASRAGLMLSETLELESRSAAGYRLIRTLICAIGPDLQLAARLETEGTDPGELLTRMNSVPPDGQFRFGQGFAVARSYRIMADEGAPQSARGLDLILSGWAAQLDGLAVSFTPPARKSAVDGAIELVSAPGAILRLPDDLLAVLGWDWEILDFSRGRWRSRLRLRGKEPARSRSTERQLERMTAHLAQTLAEPPGRFHERLIAARWGVTLRRALPLIAYAGLILAALATTRLNLPDDSPVRMLIFNAPPLLVVGVFSMRRQPRIEIPPVPRRLTATDWRPAPPSPAS